MNSFNIHADTLRVVLLGLLMASGASEVVAALGQAPSTLPAASTSTAAPTAKMSAAATNAQSSLYTLHEVQLENGTRVREFATPAGLVFAVSWRGPVLPDLSSLLGSYFNTFKLETDQARMMGKHGSPVIIERADLVVRSGGRMRNFFGHAYAPDLVPAGVNVKDVLQ